MDALLKREVFSNGWIIDDLDNKKRPVLFIFLQIKTFWTKFICLDELYWSTYQIWADVPVS